MAYFNTTKRIGFAVMVPALLSLAAPSFAQPANGEGTNAATTAKPTSDAKPTVSSDVKKKSDDAVEDGDRVIKRAATPSQKERGKALLYYEAAIRSNPRNWLAHLKKANNLYLLQRYDESLDSFNFVNAEFRGEVEKDPDVSRGLRQLDGRIKELGDRVGALTVTVAKDKVMVFIDGRMKFDGRSQKLLPYAPISVSITPGPHFVRVYKEEHEVFEQEIDIVPGKPAAVAAALTPIKDPGFIVIPALSGPVMDILIDGIPMGLTGKETQTIQVPPGEHSVSLRLHTPHEAPSETCDARTQPEPTITDIEQAESASEPVVTTVKKGGRATVDAKDLEVKPLKAVLRITPYPPEAKVFVDRKFVGKGLYVARTTSGKHRVKIVADGYIEGKEEWVEAIPDEEVAKELRLEKDLDASRWKRKKFVVEAYGGVSLAPSFGGELAAECTNDCQENLGVGPRAGLRFGYETARGFGIGLSAGYLQLQQTRTGRPTTMTLGGKVGVKGAVDDTTNIETLSIGAYASYKLGERFPLRLGLGAGALLGNLTHQRVGSFGTQLGAQLVGPVAQSGFLPWIYVEPEARVGVQITSGLSVGVNISGMVLIAPKVPQWNGDMSVNAHGETEDTLGKFESQPLTAGVFFTMSQSLYVQVGF